MDSFKIKQNSKWAIIGAGIGGMASAIRLKAAGFEPVIYEANPYAGGKLTELRFSGFRFDAGPSLMTMPTLLEDLFLIHNQKLSDYFDYFTLEEGARYFFEDGVQIHGYTDNNKFAEEIQKKTKDGKDQVLSFLRYSAKIYNITSPVFLQKSLHQFSTYLNSTTLSSLMRLFQIDFGRTMNKANNRFFKDPKTIQIFNRYATYNGSNPFRAPATLNVIPHLENYYGAFFPKMGMISITQALEKLIHHLHIPIYFSTPVEEIILENNRVNGVKILGKPLSYGGIISNMDIYPTYHTLLPGKKWPKRTLKRERSSSALIFYWGLKESFPELDLHNLFFSESYEEEFKAIARGQIYYDPSVYINITSKYKPNDAPSGMENWFTMINVPSNTGQNWETLIQEARANILKKLERILKKGIYNLIVAEKVLDPIGIEAKTSSFQGSLYGTSSNHPFSAFFRHPNFSSRYPGLYFCGGSVHPGGGIPLALLSAKITSELIMSREKGI